MKLDRFTQSYLKTALWSSHDNADESGGEPLDANYSTSDFAPEAIAQAIEDCAQFRADNEADLTLVFSMISEERAGHDFWLNRNGYGTGFWDEYYGKDESMRAAFLRLSKSSKIWGVCDAYVGYDGQIYLA